MVFWASLQRRGRKAADDKLFLKALHLSSVEDVPWLARANRFGKAARRDLR
jgi:hypothetical protein